MSFDTGQAGAYVPPPPPARARRSPWLYVGIGCGLLFLLVVGGCVAALGIMGNRIQQEMKKPINKQEVLAALKDAPIYPNAQFHEQATKGGRAGLSLMSRFLPAESTAVAAFVTADDDDKVLSWYEKKLPTLGYQPATQGGNVNFNAGAAGAKQRQYKKGQDMLMVQVQPNRQRGDGSSGGDASSGAGGSSSGNVIVLMRFNGLRGKGFE